MQQTFPSVQSFLSYYHLTLSLGDIERYMGRVNHLQVFELPSEVTKESHSHFVRFYDGGNHRELQGKVHLGADAVLTLDMGGGKTYRFKKQDA